MNVNSALQFAQNVGPTKMNGVLVGSNPGGTKKVKALSTPIAGVTTRRRKLWRSQLPGKSELLRDL
jgi:hypothetical protein